MPVTGAIPAVAGDLVGLADSTGREHDCFRLENLETPALAIVAEGADDSFAFLDQGDDANLHVDIDALVNSVVLQRPDHFQTRAIADVGQPRILMSAEVSLENAAIPGAI